MCVYFLGKRHAGENHSEAVKFFKSIQPGDAETSVNAGRIIRILNVKNVAEYEDRLVTASEAGKIFKDCKRFLEYVKKKLPAQ